jgi:hypothetical protein
MEFNESDCGAVDGKSVPTSGCIWECEKFESQSRRPKEKQDGNYPRSAFVSPTHRAKNARRMGRRASAKPVGD